MPDLMETIGELMPTMLKYTDIDPKFIKIQVEEFKNGAQIKIISDKKEISTALIEVLLMMSKINEENPNCKVEVIKK